MKEENKYESLGEFYDPNEEVTIFDDETVKQLLKEKDDDGKYLYTKKDIAEAKKEGERLLKLADEYDFKEHGKWKEAKYDENGEFDFWKYPSIEAAAEAQKKEQLDITDLIEEKEIVKLDSLNNEELETMTPAAIVASIIEFDQTYSPEEEKEMKRGLSTYDQHMLQYAIGLINMKNKPSSLSKTRIEHEINSIKDLIKYNIKFPETFNIDPAMIQLGLKAIKLHNVATYKNENKKKKVLISNIMPYNKCIKYGFCVGQIFESQNEMIKFVELASGCKISLNTMSSWKKVGYLKEIK